MDGFDEEKFYRLMGSGGFGKKETKPDISTQIERTKREDTKKEKQQRHRDGKSPAIAGPSAQRPTPDAEDEDEDKNRDKDEEDEDEDDEDEDEDEDEFPTSHNLTFKTHDKAVTTVAVDPAGARMGTASMDGSMKLYDFASMTPSTLRAFKSVEPSLRKHAPTSEVHPVYNVQFNPLSPGFILAVCATPQAKVLDRDGDTLMETVKGDMYLRDMRNTKGHISAVTCGSWSPVDYNLFVTAGTDSTLRIWDVNQVRAQKDIIVHKSRAPGQAGRTKMTAVAWGSPTGGGNDVIVSSGLDGSMAMWSGRGPFTRPSGEIHDAYARDTWVTGLDISPDGRLVVSRSEDTIKLWDTRKFKQPVNSIPHPAGEKFYQTANIKFSPNGANVVTGSHNGDLHILNPATLQAEHITPITPGSPLISVAWHETLNQIITGSANGEAHVLYNPSLSHHGAVTIMTRAPKRRHIDENPALTTNLTGNEIIVNSAGQLTAASGVGFAGGSDRHNNRPNIGLSASGRPRDPRRPHIPAQTPFARFQPDERHIKEVIAPDSRDEDPREALLRYAEVAEKDKVFTSVYQETQPKPIFAEISDEEDGEEGGEKGRRKKARR